MMNRGLGLMNRGRSRNLLCFFGFCPSCRAYAGKNWSKGQMRIPVRYCTNCRQKWCYHLCPAKRYCWKCKRADEAGTPWIRK